MASYPASYDDYVYRVRKELEAGLRSAPVGAVRPAAVVETLTDGAKFKLSMNCSRPHVPLCFGLTRLGSPVDHCLLKRLA